MHDEEAVKLFGPAAKLNYPPNEPCSSEGMAKQQRPTPAQAEAASSPAEVPCCTTRVLADGNVPAAAGAWRGAAPHRSARRRHACYPAAGTCLRCGAPLRKSPQGRGVPRESLRPPLTKGSSRFRGVSWSANSSKWRAQARFCHV